MPNKNYLAGRRFEYRVRNYFRKQRYTVLRTAGSKGPVDLIAIPEEGKDPILFVQCKNRRPTMAETAALRTFAERAVREQPPGVPVVQVLLAFPLHDGKGIVFA